MLLPPYTAAVATAAAATAEAAMVRQTTAASSNGSIQNFPPVLVEKSELHTKVRSF